MPSALCWHDVLNRLNNMAMKATFGRNARKELSLGVELTARAVVTTLGPRSQNVAIERRWGPPSILHDGVSVAKEILWENPLHNMGAQLVIVAAKKTNDVSGDGTTTSTLLTNEILLRGNILVNSGSNAMMLNRGIEKAVEIVISEIKKISTPVKDEDILKVATISAQNPKIGKLVADAIEKVGKDGVITAQESNGLDMFIDYKEGMEFDNGYLSPYFSTNIDKLETEIADPYILLTDKKLYALNEMMPMFEQIMKANKKIVIIADDVMGEVLAALVTNRMQHTIIPLAVKAPHFGEKRLKFLEDMAVLTGATVITEESGRKLQSVTLAECGRAERVWSDENSTRIIGGKGNQERIDARVEEIKNQLKTIKTDVERETLKSRLAKLTNGVAIINVGATTEVEMKELKERVIDAASATKAALEEGVVPGGGVTLLRARKALEPLRDPFIGIKIFMKIFGFQGDEEKEGIEIVYQALSKPIQVLASNSGVNPKSVLKKVLTSQENNYGFDCVTRTFGNMLERGIIDSTKVVRSSLENAASVGTMILTTGAIISHIPDKKEDKSEQK